jgi:L-cysteine:1D-myo-inositol 2-amino-2-deoxy-alpha-D-glucopyranoside ligase
MHVAMVFMNGHKMSKSLGNLVFVDKLRTEWDPRSIRMAIIEHSYRNEWECNDTLMPAAPARLAAWPASADSQEYESVLQDVRNALDEDLDTPAVVSIIDQAAAAGFATRRAAALLGVNL